MIICTDSFIPRENKAPFKQYIYAITENMMNEEAILVWIEENLNENMDVIEDLSHAQIKQMVQDREYVLIYTCKLV